MAASKERDGALFAEDCVGFFFAPDESKEQVYQIYFNALGTCYDAMVTFPTSYSLNQDRAWNGTYEVKTARGEGYWSLEARIPVKTFGIESLAPGTTWRFNCRRKESLKHSSADFQVPIMARPEDYGILVFAGQQGE